MTSLLWITAELPDRNGGGGNIRQHHLLRRLAAELDVDAVVAGTIPDPSLRERLRKVVEVEPAPPYEWPEGRWRRRFAELTAGFPKGMPFEVVVEEATRRRLEAAILDETYDVVVLQHLSMAPLVAHRDAAVWVLELHNVVSDRSAHLADVAAHGRHRFLWARDARRAARLERWCAERFDALVVCSEDDARRVDGHTVVVPNGVDTEHVRPTPIPAAPRIVLTASFNYIPNVDGARWFVDEVLPIVRASVPDAEIELVGRAPLPEVHELARRPGVRASFDVPSVLPHLAAARVAVVPLRVGSGTRLKALEAMAAGRPVVGTPVGLAGLAIEPGTHAAVADDPAPFAAAVTELLRDDQRATAMAAAARELAETTYSWDVVGAGYVAALRDLL